MKRSKMLFEETRISLSKLGLPLGDNHSLETSNLTFPDGGNFRLEIPTVNSADALDAILNESNKSGFIINRITETYGIFRHTRSEIRKMVELCTEYGCALVMSPGPRASYDVSASANSLEGKTLAYRLRGQEQVVRAIEDIKRGFDLGVTSFLIYDEGLLWVLNEMRNSRDISPDVKFKVSAHCGHGNPASFKLLEKLGANTINPVRDLDLSMLSAIRSAIKIPIDCHTDNPKSSGGFIRYYEVPEIIRVASPVYLKSGNSTLDSHGYKTTAKEGVNMAIQASIVLEMIENHFSEAKQSKIN